MKFQVLVSWLMAPYSDVVGCQHFWAPCWLYHKIAQRCNSEDYDSWRYTKFQISN